MDRDSRSPGLPAIIIVLVTIVAYLPALRGEFLWDDNTLIVDNPVIRAGDGLRRIWLTREPSDYYPVTNSLAWMQWRLWGARPWPYHALNIVLHAINAVLVWRVLRRLAVPGAWLVGLVFALHPVNVATAAWIIEQKNTLSMFFSLLTVLCFLKFCEGQGHRWYALSVAAFGLALLSKTAVAMLPVVLLGIVWWTRGRVRSEDVVKSVPFFLLSVLLGVVTLRFQEQHRLALELPASSVGWVSHWAVAGSVPWFYLGKALLPMKLAVIYPQWQVNDARWTSYFLGAVVIGALALFWWNRNSWGRPLFFALGYFIVMLFPVLGFLDQTFYRYSSVADHWQYYSIIAPIALAITGSLWIIKRLHPPAQRRVAWVGMLLLFALAAATRRRAGLYADNATLWGDNVTKYPSAYVAHLNLGLALAQAGQLQGAIDEFRETLRLRPDLADAHFNLGNALAQSGHLPEAIVEFQQALRFKPNDVTAQCNLANALILENRLPEAIQHYRHALELKPGSAEVHCNLAIALEQAGQKREAVKHYQESLRLNPDNPNAQGGLRRLSPAS